MDIVPPDSLNPTNPATLSYLILTLVIVVVGRQLELLLERGKRAKVVANQRDLYYQRLVAEALKMEAQELEKSLNLAQSIECVQKHNQELQNKLDDDDESDWSASNSDQESDQPSTSASGSAGANDADHQDKAERLARELADSEAKARELEGVEENICRLVETLAESNIDVTHEQSDDKKNDDAVAGLVEQIKRLEAENEELKKQLQTHKGLQLTTSKSNLDPHLLSYLEEHNDELSLAFLEKAHETLLEMKAVNPEMDFNEYIKDLKRSQANYVEELAKLRVSHKEIEIRLKLMKSKYEEELSSFNELRIEHIFKNCGAKEYVERLRQSNKLKEDMISSLKSELELKKMEISTWKSKFEDAEKQCNVYWQAWKDTQVRREQLEAEKRAMQERDRLAFDQSAGMSSSHSLIDAQVPSPPPINIPSVEEILRMTSNNANNPYNMDPNSSIPPPPPIEVPFNEILG